MNTAVATVEAGPEVGSALSLTETQVKAHIQLIQRVVKEVMIDGTHFGTVPGTSKKSLFKPGAETLGVTFRIAPSYRVEDLSDHDSIRYRVTCIGTHQVTDIVLGEGLGEASSNEEKYRWRAAVCDEEYDETPLDRRRAKWKKSDRGPYQVKQVRTEAADIANTVLKMAGKRAQVAMTINVTAASDMFTQDLEDMPTEIREGITEGEGTQRTQPHGKPTTQPPQRTQQSSGNGNGNGNGGGRCTEKQALMILKRLDVSGLPENHFLARFEIGAVAELPFKRVDEALQYIANVNAVD